MPLYRSWLADGGSSHALAASLHQIEARLTALTAEAARMQACEQFLAALGSSAIEAGTSAAWDALPKPDHAECREMLQAAGRRRCRRCTRRRRPRPRRRALRKPLERGPHIDTGAVRALLEQMEQALEEGAPRRRGCDRQENQSRRGQRRLARQRWHRAFSAPRRAWAI